MRIIIRGIESGNHPKLRTFVPDNPRDFDAYIQVHIGPKSGKESDTFTIRVATPLALDRSQHEDGIAGEWPLLVMSEFNYEDLLRWLEKKVAECQANTWDQSVEQLRRYFRYEFDFVKSNGPA